MIEPQVRSPLSLVSSDLLTLSLYNCLISALTRRPLPILVILSVEPLLH